MNSVAKNRIATESDVNRHAHGRRRGDYDSRKQPHDNIEPSHSLNACSVRGWDRRTTAGEVEAVCEVAEAV
jgi:hypothetical protein